MEMLWKSDLENGMFQNPVLFADYSDPDIIRVDDTYYMTASSFNYMPGLPILTSRDLVNWNLVNYAIPEKIPFSQYNLPLHAKGIWAPSIRYHNNKFYIFVGMPDEGIFVLEAEDPLGNWTEPRLLLAGKGYIDPCPFWDDDGTAYVIHGYAKSRIGFKSILGIFMMTTDTTKCISDDTFLYDGTVANVNPTIEGPKVYKRNSLYYIFAPAGGVKTGWQTVLRSSSIYGPYSEKIVMHQGSSKINGPHQGALVDTPYGDEWFLHFQDAGVYGRILHMQSVKWINDWPVIGLDIDHSGCGEPQMTYEKPTSRFNESPCYLQATDDFSSSFLGLQWQWTANIDKNSYSLVREPNALRLYCNNSFPTLWECPNIITQKLVCPAFTADFYIDFTNLQSGERTGIIMLGGEYSSLAIQNFDNHYSLIYLESQSHSDNTKEDVIRFTTNVDDIVSQYKKHAVFRILFTPDRSCQMSYCMNQQSFIQIPFSTLPTDHTWVGARIGMYSITVDESDINRKYGYADYTYVEIKPYESHPLH